MEETDPPATEKPDRSKDDDQSTGLPSSPKARSYECTFCRRGFSNAQALGGHMNIHRKDKAKLKQQQQHQQSSSSILLPDSNQTNTGHFPDHQVVLMFPKSSPNSSNIPLPLFSETASGHDKDQKEGLSSSSPPRSGLHEDVWPELDLELRLGHEPPQGGGGDGGGSGSSPPPTGMKKFL